MVMNPEWINTVSYTPLLRHTLLAPLLSEYVPDGVGISPTTLHHMAVSMVTTQQEQQAGSPTTVAKPKNGKFPQTNCMEDNSEFLYSFGTECVLHGCTCIRKLVQQVILIWWVWLE